ncbi:MAG: hypothetical protein AMXMBFR33_56990 [Candidatus Xenobia bacterium]
MKRLCAAKTSLLVLAACLMGCTGGDTLTINGNAVPMLASNVQVRHENDEDFIVEDVTEYHYTGEDAAGNEVFTQQLPEGEVHELIVPTSVTLLRIEYYAPDPDGEGQILRHGARLPVDLSDGGESVNVFAEHVQAGATLPTTLVNNSSTPLNVYVFGVLNGTQSYMEASGAVKAYTSGLNVPSVATIPAKGTKSLSLPAFQALGRVYFSKGDLSFSGWELAPSYSSKQLFDFVEYTYTSPTLVANTTCVDAFSLPFIIQTTPANQQNVGGWFPPKVGIDAGGRTKIFQAVQALGAPWNKLIVMDGQTPIRLLAPWRKEAISAGFPTNVLAASINNQWGKAIPSLNTYGFGTYTAAAAPASGDWTFTPQGGGAAVTFAKPDSTAAFACVLTLKTAAGGPASRINDILAVGLNRGTLLNKNTSPSCIPFTAVTPGQPDFTPANFYVTSAQVPVVNQYSKILHQNSLGPTEPSAGCPGTGVTFQYGLAPDNEGNVSSQLQNNTVATFTITVSSF